MNSNYCQKITLYYCLKAKDNPEKKDRWQKIVLDRCFYKAGSSVFQNSVEMSRVNTYTVRIPEDTRYLPYGEWRELPEEERVRYFTVSEGDLVVKGDCPDEITETDPAVKVLLRRKPDAFTVRSFSDNTVHPLGKHYRLGG